MVGAPAQGRSLECCPSPSPQGGAGLGLPCFLEASGGQPWDRSRKDLSQPCLPGCLLPPGPEKPASLRLRGVLPHPQELRVARGGAAGQAPEFKPLPQTRWAIPVGSRCLQGAPVASSVWTSGDALPRGVYVACSRLPAPELSPGLLFPCPVLCEGGDGGVSAGFRLGSGGPGLEGVSAQSGDSRRPVWSALPDAN